MNLKNLETEQRNPRTMHIDSMNTLDMARTINLEDTVVTTAVETALPDIARLIDGICERLQNGGSLYYIGAGPLGDWVYWTLQNVRPPMAFPPVGSGNYSRWRFRAPQFQ